MARAWPLLHANDGHSCEHERRGHPHPPRKWLVQDKDAEGDGNDGIDVSVERDE
jgi:hypothetical protein